MKRVLIISPHFPPINAADMQRVRHSLPYFKSLGWEPEVIAVDIDFVESYSTDYLLNETLPEDVTIHHVKAYDASKTRKFGLGSISMRSFFQYMKKGNELLANKKFDLVYFTTTAFHVMALGRYWKQKFGVPFVLDIQDPWRNDFYLDKPKNERPPKFFISYNIDKYLEMYTMKKVDGIISVSHGYVDMFLDRYKHLHKDQFKVIPFGYSKIDFEVAESHIQTSDKVILDSSKVNIVYIGRGGHDMKLALTCFFSGLAQATNKSPEVKKKVKCWFVGTSYATQGQGVRTIKPIAEQYGVSDNVEEITDRIPFFESLFLLKKARALFVPGSTDKSYTASKIYQYVLAKRPLLAIFYKKSSIVTILNEAQTGTVLTFDDDMNISQDMIDSCDQFITNAVNGDAQGRNYNESAFETYSALSMTKQQVDFFNKIVD